ncbi:hypothetical protein HEAFMP_HEAFMP_03105, partial [Dysosmobacter welbionis]
VDRLPSENQWSESSESLLWIALMKVAYERFLQFHNAHPYFPRSSWKHNPLEKQRLSVYERLENLVTQRHPHFLL